MRQGTSQEEATLLDVLVDGFEKNETIAGFHWRTLPMPDEAAAARKFEALADEGATLEGRPDPGGAWPVASRGRVARPRDPAGGTRHHGSCAGSVVLCVVA